MSLTTYNSEAGSFRVNEVGSDSMRTFYEREGWIVLRQLFDPVSDYGAVHSYINHLIDLKLAQLGMVSRDHSSTVRTKDYLRICERDRSMGGQIYRACRQLLPLHQMATSSKVVNIAKFLMNTEFINSNPFTAMRIDQRAEQQYLFEWHQDYPYTQGSLDGIVIWGSLFDLGDGDGGIKFLSGSHKNGLQKVLIKDAKNEKKNGAHSIQIADTERFDLAEALRVDLKAGDVLVFSTLLLHKSMQMDRGDVRWAFQIRHSNFSNLDSVNRGWPGGSALGDNFESLHPEFVA